MPLSINNLIEEHHIYGAVALAKGHPVFQLEGYGENGVLDTIIVLPASVISRMGHMGW